MKKKDTTENKNLWRWNSNLVPMTQDHDPSTHEPNSANAAWSAGSIRLTSSNISLCSLLKKFEFLSYYWAYLMIMMMMMMMIMMTMIYFLGMVDWRKTLNVFFSQNDCCRVLSIANLRHTTKRIFPCAEPEFRFCWMKLYSSDNRHTNFSNKKAPSKYFLFHLEK